MAITPLPTPPSRSTPSTFSTLADAFLSALPTFQSEANTVALAMDLNDTSDTSASSITIGTGAKTFVVTAGKSFLPGMSLKIARTSSPSNWMHGDVTTYATTSLVMNILSIQGSGGPFTDWTITFSAPTIVPTAVAESDFMVGAPSPFGSWVKKTLVEAKALLGLVITAGKTITCTQDTSLDEAVAMSSKLATPGAWTTPAFNAGDFTSDSGTWVVASGDVFLCKYIIMGKIMILSVDFLTTTITGAPLELYFKVPATKTATATMKAVVALMLDNNVLKNGLCYSNGTNIVFAKTDSSAFAASTNLTRVATTLTFEIN